MDYASMSNEELEQLVNNKDADAICELGERCLYGTGGHEVNLTRAYQLFHKGEKMGLPRAYLGLGEMYRNGMRFAKNENLAREYYKKAGAPYPANTVAPQPQKAAAAMPVQPNFINAGVTYADIKLKIDSAEQARGNGDYGRARFLCNEVLHTVNDILSGAMNYSGSQNVRDLLTKANWILAYTAFNEQNYLELDNYLAANGVQESHPWGVYLSAIGHQNMQAPPSVIEQDLQMLIMVNNNQNLSQTERGDVCAMIGDLIFDGYGAMSGLTVEMAKFYYEEAMYCGNEYAKEVFQQLH